MLDPEAARTTRWWLSKPFLIIVVAGGFHLGRGAPVDGAIFLGTAAALAFAEITKPAPLTGSIPVPAVLAAVPLGWVISTWQPGSAPVAVAVALTGPPMLLLALRSTGEPGPLRPGWYLWAALGVLVCLWELAQFLQQPDARTDSWDHPTLSVVLDPLFVPGPGRTVLAIGWLAAGVLLARLMLGSHRCTR